MPTTLAQLKRYTKEKRRFACLTAYDASFSHWISEAGCEVMLVGDSLGMVVQGHDRTLPVTLEQMCYHTELVARGNSGGSWIMADMPFMADATVDRGLDAAQALIQAGAQMVKLEGGPRIEPLVRALSELGVPVCAHLGLLPQSVLKHGWRSQGDRDTLLNHARLLMEAGADMLLLECVTDPITRAIVKESSARQIPVIGIGSGKAPHGQVLVLYDILGLTPGKLPSFARNFMPGCDSIQCAIHQYVQAVKSGQFPE